MTHEPTSSGAPHHDPTVCYCCGRRAVGIGMGRFPTEWKPNQDPQFLCPLCIMIIDQIRSVVSFDHYEVNAIQATIDALGPTIEANGTDLGDWSHDQVTAFIGEVILTFGEAIREQVRTNEVPFP